MSRFLYLLFNSTFLANLQEKVLDLVLLEDDGDRFLKLMMVSERGNETLLSIREYPSFKVLYELQVWAASLVTFSVPFAIFCTALSGLNRSSVSS